MEIPLLPHPARRAASVSSVVVQLQRPGPDHFHLRYLISGAPDALKLPPPAPPGRKDELWKSTCFELFLRRPGATAYDELNFSPSSQWAAYSFSDYREGMSPLILTEEPSIRLERGGGGLVVDVRFTSSLGLEARRAALTAVVEEQSGRKSYWALAHPPDGPPDFHHPDCFLLDLPSP